MNTSTIKDLANTEELGDEALSGVVGGMMKRPFQNVGIGDLLTNQLGDPIAVYVDGLLVNSVSTGYAPK